MPAPAHFEIHCDDLARARKFYAAVFGWAFRQYSGPPMEYWLIDTREPGAMMGGMLPRPGKLAGLQPPNAFVVTMGVASLDETLSKALAAGATLAVPKFGIPGIGWQAYVLDTEGNVIGLHQTDPAATA